MTDNERIDDIDAALVARTLQGESVAYELLVVKYQRRLAAAVRKLVRDDRITEELTQEAFLQAYSALSRFDPAGSFAAWLFTIGRNIARSYLRSAQNRQDDRPLQGGDGAEEPPAGNGVAASPEDEVMAAQMFAQINAEIDALPDIQRKLLLMREIDGLTYAGIAEKSDLPLNTVKSHIYRARETIAQGLRPLLGPTRNRRW